MPVIGSEQSRDPMAEPFKYRDKAVCHFLEGHIHARHLLSTTDFAWVELL